MNTDQNGFSEQPKLSRQMLAFWMLRQQRRRRKRIAARAAVVAQPMKNADGSQLLNADGSPLLNVP